MQCSNCKKEINNGYFQNTDEGMMCICTECLRKYDSIRKKHKFDCMEIYRMHEKGYSDRSIATYFETNPLTIGWILKDLERNL